MDGVDAKLALLDKNFDTIYLGFSGGLDSRALLDLLLHHKNICQKLTIIHVNHELSPHANDWMTLTQQTAESYGVSFRCYSVNVAKNNLEESARNERYKVFDALLKNEREVLLLAHHQNDQAETLLLHLCRGAGVDGLAAMPEWRSLGKGKIYRPLLNISRQELEKYAAEKQLMWIEDESNTNQDFSRNFLRHHIIPQLQNRWPGLINNLCRSAKHCASAKTFIDTTITETLHNMMDEQYRLSIAGLLTYPRDTQKIIIRLWLEKQGFKKPNEDKINRIIDEVILAKEDANPLVAWREAQVRRYQCRLYALGAAGRRFNRQSPQNLPKSLPNNYEIRYRKGGEKIRLNGKNRDLKKLFQEWKIPPWERGRIPLIYVNNVLVCVDGWVVSDDFCSTNF